MPTEAERFKSFWKDQTIEEHLANSIELVKFLRSWNTTPTTLAADHIELLRKKLDAQPS